MGENEVMRDLKKEEKVTRKKKKEDKDIEEDSSERNPGSCTTIPSRSFSDSLPVCVTAALL